MSLNDIVAGDYGQVIELTFIDVDTSLAADISGYSTTIEMVFTQPDGTPASKSATFKTDGSDGITKYTVEDGFLTSGWWKVRGRVKSANATLTTVEHRFRVIA